MCARLHASAHVSGWPLHLQGPCQWHVPCCLSLSFVRSFSPYVPSALLTCCVHVTTSVNPVLEATVCLPPFAAPAPQVPTLLWCLGLAAFPAGPGAAQEDVVDSSGKGPIGRCGRLRGVMGQRGPVPAGTGPGQFPESPGTGGWGAGGGERRVPWEPAGDLVYITGAGAEQRFRRSWGWLDLHPHPAAGQGSLPASRWARSGSPGQQARKRSVCPESCGSVGRESNAEVCREGRGVR